MVPIQHTQRIQLGLLVGPKLLCLILEIGTAHGVSVEIVVVRQGIGKAISRHHEVTPHVSIGIHPTSAPAVLQAVQAHIGSDVGIDARKAV